MSFILLCLFGSNDVDLMNIGLLQIKTHRSRCFLSLAATGAKFSGRLLICARTQTMGRPTRGLFFVIWAGQSRHRSGLAHPIVDLVAAHFVTLQKTGSVVSVEVVERPTKTNIDFRKTFGMAIFCWKQNTTYFNCHNGPPGFFDPKNPKSIFQTNWEKYILKYLPGVSVLNPPPSSARLKSFSFLNEMSIRNSSLPISSKIEIENNMFTFVMEKIIKSNVPRNINLV